MAVFKAFKPEAMNKIAKAMGYSGDMGQFQSYIEQDPMRQQQMQRYTNAAMQMAKGGVVKMQTGGLTPQAASTPTPQTQPDSVQQATIQRMYQPGLPTGGVTTAAMTPSEAGQYITPQVGTVTGQVGVPTAM